MKINQPPSQDYQRHTGYGRSSLGSSYGEYLTNICETCNLHILLIILDFVKVIMYQSDLSYDKDLFFNNEATTKKINFWQLFKAFNKLYVNFVHPSQLNQVLLLYLITMFPFQSFSSLIK